jgi:uracil-DNA glycosylase family 4
VVTTYERQEFIDQLYYACKSCVMCELGRKQAVKNGVSRDPHVLSNRNPSRFVVVGQNPGWDEIGANQPFVGAAGKNFDKEIEKHGLVRNDFYITNTCKCWTNGNMRPTYKHVKQCSPFLRMELQTLMPLLVVALGSVAFNVLCPGVNFSQSLCKLTASQEYDVQVFTIYHPSPLNLNSGRRGEFERQIRILCKIIQGLKQLKTK